MEFLQSVLSGVAALALGVAGPIVADNHRPNSDVVSLVVFRTETPEEVRNAVLGEQRIVDNLAHYEVGPSDSVKLKRGDAMGSRFDGRAQRPRAHVHTREIVVPCAAGGSSPPHTRDGSRGATCVLSREGRPIPRSVAGIAYQYLFRCYGQQPRTLGILERLDAGTSLPPREQVEPKRDDQPNYGGEAEPHLPPSPPSSVTRGFDSLPLSAKVGISVAFMIPAWLVIFFGLFRLLPVSGPVRVRAGVLFILCGLALFGLSALLWGLASPY